MTRILNDFERQLINLLTEDARMSVTELAAVLGVSRPKVKNKIDQLTEIGVIKRFTIELGEIDKSDNEAAQMFFYLKLKGPICRKIWAQIKTWPEIQGCWSLSSSDLDMLILINAHSRKHLDVVRDKIATNEHVQTMFTTFVLDEWAHKL